MRVIANKYTLELNKNNKYVVNDNKVLVNTVKTTKSFVEDMNNVSLTTGILYEIDEKATIENNIELARVIKLRENNEQENNIVKKSNPKNK